MASKTKVIYSDQYSLPCVSVENFWDIDADALIAECEANGAVRYVDGVEYVAELRSDVGPELWTEASLQRSLKAPVPWDGKPETWSVRSK